jgi:hypothetical protein
MLKTQETVKVLRISGQQLLIQAASLCIGEELAPQGFLRSSRPEDRKDLSAATEYHGNSDGSGQDGHMFLSKLSLELCRLVMLKELMAHWDDDDEMCKKAARRK